MNVTLSSLNAPVTNCSTMISGHDISSGISHIRDLHVNCGFDLDGNRLSFGLWVPERKNSLVPIMAGNMPFRDLLEARGTLIIDGALATELESRGCNLNDPVWSTKALLEKPELVQQVHEDYFRAGADIAITASYQAISKTQALKGTCDKATTDLITKSVIVAQQARRNILDHEPRRTMLIAGSIGPYGAALGNGSEYTGECFLPVRPMQDFHRPRIQALVDAGVDLLACETMPSYSEIRNLLQLLRDEFSNIQVWISFTLHDALHLADRTPLSTVLSGFEESPNIVAVGVNCIGRDQVTPALRHMSSLTSLPIVVYPNSGEKWNAKSREWYGSSTSSQALASLVKEWHAGGARLIGGCCRTGPKDIKVIKATIGT